MALTLLLGWLTWIGCSIDRPSTEPHEVKVLGVVVPGRGWCPAP